MRIGMSVTLPAIFAAAALSACSEPGEPVNEAVNEDLNTEETGVPAEGANSFTEEQARGQIENAGYSDVSALTLSDNGLWQGTATSNGATVNVSVDYRGVVTTQPGAAAPVTSTTPPAPAIVE